MEKAKVYFTKEITSEKLIEIYNNLDKKLNGNVGVKISTGEPGGKHFLNPNLIKDLVSKVNGTIIECNTAYKGRRNTTEEHLKAVEEHGFTKIAKVDILDSEGEIPLGVSRGKHLKVNYVGKNLQNYDSILMLSHFKGHAMGGFGGALKNMSIGIASRNGKAWIHTAGITNNPDILWDNIAKQDDFLESMAEADLSVMEYFDNNIVYINVINNLSVDCDCSSNPAKPCMKDIGIMASTDPVALDKACLDLIYKSTDDGKKDMIERIERQHGTYIINYAKELEIGTDEYEVIDIDAK